MMNDDEALMNELPDLQLSPLLEATACGKLEPKQVLQTVHAAAHAARDKNVWIELAEFSALERQLADAQARNDAGVAQPLFGVPFAVKDNIDAVGFHTTAACPSYSYAPGESAPVVERLIQAGAILLGKTNMDQFATGLVGTRSPYGACASAFDPTMIAGGSSSGSALAVALGWVSFALGTDTAGSGRVPAGFNNIVGLKPSKGLLSARGVVPACRSLDCVSIFAGSVTDAERVFQLARGFDPLDPYARAPSSPPALGAIGSDGPFRFGVPEADQLEFFGDNDSATAFERACAHLESQGGTRVAIDFGPFRETACLLYSGPWVAERALAVGDFIATRPDGLDERVAAIISGGERWTARDAFSAEYQLQGLRKRAAKILDAIDVLFLPTTPTAYSLAEISAEPVELNSRLGTYTNFVNLLDLCGVAVPAGFKSNGLPFGVTLLAPAPRDQLVCQLARRFNGASQGKVGATPWPVVEAASTTASSHATEEPITLAVVGAHLRGQPLHDQLTALAAVFVRADRTAAKYQLFALDGTKPSKPGLQRCPAGGVSIEVELYALDPAAFGRFTAMVPAPLSIGNVELASGEWVKGFLCEAFATRTARDISELGGWRAYVAALAR
jgi:allophanate hydrolase